MIDSTPTARPRHTWQTIALLAVLTLLNVVALIALVVTWVDEVDHGADFGDDTLNYLLFAGVLQAAAVTALVAAWFTRLWGAHLYLGVQAFALLVLLVAAPAAFGIQNVLPVVFAALLVAICGKAWRGA